MHINLTLFYDSKQGYTFLMYTKPVKGSKDWQSLYRSTKLDGFEIGEVAQVLYIVNFNRPIPIYYNSYLAPRLGGIKQKKSS